MAPLCLCGFLLGGWLVWLVPFPGAGSLDGVMGGAGRRVRASDRACELTKIKTLVVMTGKIKAGKIRL